jgi:transcriptional regulator with XRE-family HTH domain
MGRTRRRKPKRLAQKLLAIRKKLGVSQPEMAKLLDLRVTYTVVSAFERGKQEPDLIILLRYARLAGVSTDVVIDDKLDLPK